MNIYANVVLGWTPILAVVADGSREVLEVTGWTGGSGTAPATGVYVGATGYVSNIALAVDIKGSDGVGVDVIAGTNTISSGAVNFSAANGVTFGLSGSTMTASVRTDYQSSGNYLTTAMQSNAGSNFVNTSQSSLFQQTSAMSNYQTTGNYLTTAMQSNASLSNLGDVSFSSIQAGQHLVYDGAKWINGSVGGAGGAAGAVMFFSHGASGISTYETIQSTPSTDPEQNELVTVNNSTVLIDGYCTPTPLGRTVINAGVWDFNIFGYATGGSNLIFEVYKRTSGGTETLLFTATSDEITNSSVALLNFSSVQGAFSVNTTDYLLVKVYATTTNSVNIDVHFVYAGTTNYSHIHTPISSLHNDLDGLQGGSSNEYYHLNATEYGFRNTAATSIYQQTSAMSAYLTNAKISAGTLSALRSDFTLGNSNGVSFGLNTNGVITASVNAAGGAQTGISGISAGTTILTSGTLSFGDSNGISFGLNGSVLTATVKTDYQSSGNYLTTAMASNAGSNFVNTSAGLNLTNISATLGSGSISLSVGNYITTAAQSNQVVNSLNGSTGQISLATGSSLSSSQNGSTITFGLASNITTALQSAGNYLTTAAQSNQVVNSINGSTGVFSFNSGSSLSSSRNGNSITWGLASNITTALQSAGNYLTTAAQSNQVVNSLNGSTGQISLNVGSSLSASTNGSSITFGLASNITTALQSAGNYLTTAMASDAGSRFVNTSAGLNLTNISATLGSGSLSLSVGNYITTARASTDAIGLNTAQTNVTWTANSSGISINAAGYAGTGTTFAGTNISASMTHNSNGLNLALSAANPGGGGSINFSAGTTSANLASVTFSDAGGVSFGLNAGTITASAPAAAATPVNFSAGTTSNNLGSVIFGDLNGISFGLGTGASSRSITASHNGITSQSNQNISFYAVGNTTQNSSTVLNASQLSFNGLGELSVGFSNGSINLSANVDAISAYAVSNTTQATSGTLNVGSLSFAGAGVASVGISNGSVVVSVPSGGGAGFQGGMSNLGSTAGTSGTVGSQIVFVGTNGLLLSQSVNGASATISFDDGQKTISSFANAPALINSSVMTWNGASISQAAAFALPEAASWSFLRVPALFTTNSTTIATLASATATAQGGIFSTINAVIYSLGTGASSQSLQSVVSSSGGYSFTQQISITNSTQASYSLGLSQWANGNGTSLTTQYSISNTNYSFTTNQFTAFTSARMLDVPFAASLSAGPYWLVIGMSSSTSSAGAAGLAALTNCNVRYSAHYGMSQLTVPFGIMGSTNLTSGGLMGAGSFSTAGGGTTASINISAISSAASLAMPYFQLLRSA